MTASTALFQPSQPQNNFAQIENWAIETDKLSAMAFRVYAYIRSRPPGWKPYANEMASRWGVNVGTISQALQELKAAGILAHEADRDERTGQIRGLIWRLLGVAHLIPERKRKGKKGRRQTEQTGHDQAAIAPLQQKPEARAASDVYQDRFYQGPVTPGPGKTGPIKTEFNNLDLNQTDRSAPDGSADFCIDDQKMPERAIEAPRSSDPVQRSADTSAQTEAPAVAQNGRAAGLLERCRQLASQTAQDPNYQQRLAQRQKAEARAADLHRQQQQARQQQQQDSYGVYLALPPAEAVAALCADVLKNPSPKRDRRNVRALQAWAAGQGEAQIRALVDCFRLAAAAGAYSVRYVAEVWNQLHPEPIPLP